MVIIQGEDAMKFLKVALKLNVAQQTVILFRMLTGEQTVHVLRMCRVGCGVIALADILALPPSPQLTDLTTL